MTEKAPLACAICLTADRHRLTDRAVECFLSQTYKKSHLLIYDTGKKPYRLSNLASSRITVMCDGFEMAAPIGALRNRANGLVPPGTEILAHWDSDDWSGPYRIQDQVRTLIDSGRDCVGYRTVLFWRSNPMSSRVPRDGEAWSYHNINPVYCIGASLCYWKRVWDRQRFRDTLPGQGGLGEDTEWLRHVDSQGYSTLSGPALPVGHPERDISDIGLVCEIHGGNTMPYRVEDDERGPTGWKRVPEWDGRLAEIMEL